MRKAVLFIAVSLDGFIADGENGVGWLEGQDPAAETVDFYGEFVQDIDTVVMGWRTYEQVVTELSPSCWPYGELTAYVVTHRTVPPADGVRFTGEEPCALIRRLRRESGKGVWICGGAEIAQALLRSDLIDRLCISVIPTLLGNGVRLFGPLDGERKLRLLSARTSNGITELTYERRGPALLE